MKKYKDEIILALIILAVVSVFFLVVRFAPKPPVNSAGIEVLLNQQNQEIKALRTEIKAREFRIDSIQRERNKVQERILSLQSHNQNLIHEIIKEQHRIDTMPIDGVYIELSKHIRANY